MIRTFFELTKGGFFAGMKTQYPTVFNDIFGDVSDDEIEVMDWTLSNNWGDRLLVKAYRNFDVATEALAQLVRVCVMMYSTQWKQITHTIEKAGDIDVLQPINEKRHTVENNNASDTDTTQDKTNAFDITEEASDTNSSTRNGSSERTIDRTVEIQRSGASSFANLSEALAFGKEFIALNMIMNDIVNISTIDIF